MKYTWGAKLFIAGLASAIVGASIALLTIL